MICAVFLASGRGKRFGGDKLLYQVAGVPMAERVFRALPPEMCGVVVTGDSRVGMLARQHPNLSVVENHDETDDIAVTIRLGIQALPADAEGAIFFVCDQPWLSRGSVLRLREAFMRERECIYVLSAGDRQGNPCLFPAALFGELASLGRNQGGKTVIARHGGLLRRIEAESPIELEDMDIRPQEKRE